MPASSTEGATTQKVLLELGSLSGVTCQYGRPWDNQHLALSLPLEHSVLTLLCPLSWLLPCPPALHLHAPVSPLTPR